MNTLKKSTQKKKSFWYAWIFYAIIVFEIIYMISPFGFYFYSVYGIPLKMLNSNPVTSWLTRFILPHYAETNGLLIKSLIGISWPLIIVGTLLFLVSFIQIYTAKLRKRGAVVGGLYKIIRHPQYTALAILGLGTTLYWSRYIVLFMYLTMLFLYFFLARKEEQECLFKFGDSYRDYYNRTGRFFPKFKKDNKTRTPRILSDHNPVRRTTIIILLYITLISAGLSGGYLLKQFALTKMEFNENGSSLMLSLAKIKGYDIDEIQKFVLSDIKTAERLTNKGFTSSDYSLIYIIPEKWDIPELPLYKEEGSTNGHYFNFDVHGNSKDFDQDRFKLLFVKPKLYGRKVKGKKILTDAHGIEPQLIVKVDMKKKAVTDIIEPPSTGKWKDIPVPLY